MLDKAISILSDTHPDFTFKLAKGGELKNLEELLKALKAMEQERFFYHVGERGNDFSKWIKDVIKDDKLADDIRSCREKAEMADIIRSRIIELQSFIQKQEDMASFEDLLPRDDESANYLVKDYLVEETSSEPEKGPGDEEEEEVDSLMDKNIFGFKISPAMHDKIYLISVGLVAGLLISIIMMLLIK